MAIYEHRAYAYHLVVEWSNILKKSNFMCLRLRVTDLISNSRFKTIGRDFPHNPDILEPMTTSPNHRLDASWLEHSDYPAQ